MRRRFILRAAVFAVPLAWYVAACALDESGLAPGDGSVDTGGGDAGDDACAPCATLFAQGWQLVALGANAGACPPNDSLENVSENVDAGPGLCDCACSETPGGCSTGTLNLGYLASCTSSTQLHVDGGCDTNNGTLQPGGFSAQFTPQSPAPCTAQAVVNDAAINATEDTLCHPSATCDEALCSGTAPVGYAACIIQTGDVACPAGPFQARHVIGQPAASCSACTCSCDGTFEFYYDAKCEAGAMVIDASCSSTSDPGATVRSDKWNSGGCIPDGPREGGVTLGNSRTVCCRQ